MIQLENRIFSYFGTFDKIADTNKDLVGEGTLERYNEVMGEEFDLYLDPQIENLFKNVLNPYFCFTRYVQMLEGEAGNQGLFIAGDIATRRKIQRYIKRLYSIKGTPNGYIHLLNLLGFACEIEEFFTNYSFDSEVTFDYPERRFDMFCQGCTEYCLNLERLDETTDELTGAEKKGISNIILFNQPIDTKLRCVKFYGEEIDLGDFDLDTGEPPGDFNNDFNEDFLT